MNIEQPVLPGEAQATAGQRIACRAKKNAFNNLI
jgi:hypothetical protein